MATHVTAFSDKTTTTTTVPFLRLSSGAQSFEPACKKTSAVALQLFVTPLSFLFIYVRVCVCMSTLLLPFKRSEKKKTKRKLLNSCYFFFSSFPPPPPKKSQEAYHSCFCARTLVKGGKN